MFEVKLTDEALADLDLVDDFYSNISFELGIKFFRAF